jgi:hypothetical protein
MYRQMEKCWYRTVRTGGLGLTILIYWGKGYLAWYQGCMACDTFIQLLYNDGCTAASSPYPYKGIVNAYYFFKYCDGLSQENVPETAKSPPEQPEIEKFEKTRFHVPAPPNIGPQCTGKTTDAGTPVRRSPRSLLLGYCMASDLLSFVPPGCVRRRVVG